MMPTKSKLQVEIRKIVIFGAGKIGRSFIGQLFGCSGYKVVFVDVDPVMISLLNLHGSYRVVIKGETEEEIIVPDVQAISALDKDKVIEAVATAGILAVSVGKNALEKSNPCCCFRPCKKTGKWYHSAIGYHSGREYEISCRLCALSLTEESSKGISC